MTELAKEAASRLDTATGAGRPVLDRLVALLDLEKIEENIFRSVSPRHLPVRVFGGQALVAAGRTVPSDRRVHSLHAYFIRDGHSFTTRRVVAVQHGKAIFSLSASFQKDEPGI